MIGPIKKLKSYLGLNPKKKVSPARKRTNRMNRIDKAAGGVPKRLKTKK